MTKPNVNFTSISFLSFVLEAKNNWSSYFLERITVSEVIIMVGLIKNAFVDTELLSKIFFPLSSKSKLKYLIFLVSDVFAIVAS